MTPFEFELISFLSVGLPSPSLWAPIPLMPFLLAAGALRDSRVRFILSFVSARIVRYGLIARTAANYGHIVLEW